MDTLIGIMIDVASAWLSKKAPCWLFYIVASCCVSLVDSFTPSRSLDSGNLMTHSIGITLDFDRRRHIKVTHLRRRVKKWQIFITRELKMAVFVEDMNVIHKKLLFDPFGIK